MKFAEKENELAKKRIKQKKLLESFNNKAEAKYLVPIKGRVVDGIVDDSTVKKNDLDFLIAPDHLLQNNNIENYYWLSIEDNSMVDSGIGIGFMILIEITNKYENGDILLIDNAINKSICKVNKINDSSSIEIGACTSNAERKLLSVDKLKIEGKLIYSAKYFN